MSALVCTLSFGGNSADRMCSIKREIGHLCHDEPKSQMQQPSGSNIMNPNVPSSSSSLPTLGEAHAAHLSKYPDQAPPLLEIMHGFPVPVQTRM